MKKKTFGYCTNKNKQLHGMTYKEPLNYEFYQQHSNITKSKNFKMI